ncbi:hypothetical protein Pst134EB_002035 [Puccinia striiformis f. sp. tritici]|nr:hypothetical protein Pst134EB_002035 [Puccinia striiformis f. sp. tritici]
MRSFLLFPILSFFASSLAQVIHRDHRTIQFYCPGKNPQPVCTRVTERQNDRPDANPLFMAVRDATAVYGKTSAYNCINLNSDDHYCCPINSYHFHGDDEITRVRRGQLKRKCVHIPQLNEVPPCCGGHPKATLIRRQDSSNMHEKSWTA